MSNQRRIDVESMRIDREEGKARRIRRWRPGGLCLINPSQPWSSPFLAFGDRLAFFLLWFSLPFFLLRSSCFVYFVSSLRAQTAKTLICTKSGVSADPRKSTKKCGKPHFLRKKCAKSALFRTFWRSFWDRRKPHFLCRLMFLPFGPWGSTRNTQFLLSFRRTFLAKKQNMWK